MAALDVFRAIGHQTDSKFLATEVLPILWQFSLGPLLDLAQFQAYMNLIKSLSTRVETEHTRELQELGTRNATPAAASRNDFMSFESIGGSMSTTNGNGDADFEALVRGNIQSKSTGGDMLGGDPWTSAQPSASSSATLPSRPAGIGNRTASSASPAPAFSWSTPPISPPATNLAAPRNVSRTITPDNTLSAFPAIAPSTAFPAMAPSNVATNTNSMMSPTTPSYSTQSPSINWTTAAGSGLSSSTANAWGGSTTTSATSGLSNFSIAPPPAPSQMQTRTQGSGTTNPYSGFSIAPPASRGNSSFGVAAPPGAGARSNSGLSMNSMASMQRQGNNQVQQEQRQQQPGINWGNTGSGGDSLI